MIARLLRACPLCVLTLAMSMVIPALTTCSGDDGPAPVAASKAEDHGKDGSASAATSPAAKSHEKHDHEGATAEAEGDHPHDSHGHGEMGKNLSSLTILPFASLLLCIAILPLVTPHWWEHNESKAMVVALLTIPFTAYFLLAWGSEGAYHELWHKFAEYISFMALLGSLYVISGGIYIKGSLSGTPLANTALMALGASIASIIGTTGASVVLIRPLLRANRTRKAKAHVVVFFIFIVSNCGGLLTPLGDPPLFLGFLKGVPFEWTAIHLWQHWILVNAALLVIFNIWDQVVFAREERAREGSQLEEAMKHEPLGVDGSLNFLFLAGVVLVIIASGQGWGAQYMGVEAKPGEKALWPFGVAEVMMCVLCLLAWFTTASANREANKFTFGPIIEVAVLFIGIFITMAPALLILNAWGNDQRPELGKFAITEVWQYFWATGVLSSFLDNAPTYLTFAATACGQNHIDTSGAQYLGAFASQSDETRRLLQAISCGAVFMGANTYIGNGPNFMVKAIAEENGVHMPSFFGYMSYSCLVLVPLLVLVTFVFFV